MLSTKWIVSLISISLLPPLFLWRSSCTAAHPGVFSGLVLLISFVSWTAAMLTLLLWRKVNSSVIFPLIPLAYHCISRIRCWCRFRSMVHFDVADTLRQNLEQQCRHRPLLNQVFFLRVENVRKSFGFRQCRR